MTAPPRHGRPPERAPGLQARHDSIHRPYVPLSRRRRVLVALLAAITAIGIVLLMLDPPGGVQRKRPPPSADVPACAPGQTAGCVGSRTLVLPGPAAPGASAATGVRER